MRYVFGFAVLGFVLLAPANAQMQGPRLVRVARAVQEAYPSDAVRREASVAALLEVWVDQNGKIFHCQLISSVGDERLAKEACSLVIRHGRGKIEPATDRAGRPAIGRMRDLLKMEVMESKDQEAVTRAWEPPEIELNVASLPNAEHTKDVDLLLSVEADGRVVDCAGAESKADPYVDAGCKSLVGNSFLSGRGPGNVPMPYVASVKLRFSAP